MSYEEKPRYETREYNAIHQPVLLCLDTSGSMSDVTEDGSLSKVKLVENMVNSLANIDLTEADKGAIDICIMAFDDKCRVLQDWIPLSLFKGDISLDAAGRTSLGSAIINSIDAVRARRKVYNTDGIGSRRAQIFLYTDGVSTEDMSAAIKRSQEYLNRDRPSAKLYAILIPPAQDPSEFKALGEKVAILRAPDCVNGIPKTFKFLRDSVVAWSSSNPGETVNVNMEGIQFVSGQGGAVKNSDGSSSMSDVIDFGDIWEEA